MRRGDRHQLRAGRQQPSDADAGGVSPVVAAGGQGAHLRREPAGAGGVRRHGHRAHRHGAQRPCPAHGRQRGAGHAVGHRQHQALLPGHARHGHRRGQRGVHRRRRGAQGQPGPGHAQPARGAGADGHGRVRARLHGQLPRRARQLLPAVAGRLHPGVRRPHAPLPPLPRRDQRPILDQRIPLLRIQGRPRKRVAVLRAVGPVPRRRGGPVHPPPVHEHAVRAGGRRELRGGAAGLRRDPGVRVGDRVAVQGRRRRGGRHGGERPHVQPEPAGAAGGQRGHAAAATPAAGGVPLRALQRGHEARAHLREELRTLPARRQDGLQRRPHAAADGHVGGVTLPRRLLRAAFPHQGCQERLHHALPLLSSGHPAYLAGFLTGIAKAPNGVAICMQAQQCKANGLDFCGPKASSQTKGRGDDAPSGVAGGKRKAWCRPEEKLPFAMWKALPTYVPLALVDGTACKYC